MSASKVSPEARAVLSKLPPADLITVMEGMQRAADNNNQSNFSKPADQMTDQEVGQTISKIPPGQLRNVLTQQGIIKADTSGS